jgi:hypothetical protein
MLTHPRYQYKLIDRSAWASVQGSYSKMAAFATSVVEKPLPSPQKNTIKKLKKRLKIKKTTPARI